MFVNGSCFKPFNTYLSNSYYNQVLITKLRSANTIETRQYRKASKALLVLIPLLGITYLVVITGPESGVFSNIFAVIRATLLSTQVCM
jgi:corticotropin releasing hormone receptor 1